MDYFIQNQPFQFGESIYTRGGKYGPVKQEYLDLMLILSGELIVKAGGNNYKFSENHSILIYSESVLEVVIPRNQRCHVMWCHTGELTLEHDEKSRLKSLPVSLPPSDLLRVLFREGIKLGHGSNINLTRLRNSLGAALYNEYFHLAHLEEEEHDLPPAIWRAKKYLEAHYQKRCSLEEVALAAKLNPRYLIELFKQYLGRSPTKYLWHLRGEKAVNLLLQSGLTVSEIAYRCGFQTPHHFSRFIKEHYQQTPTQIRNNTWQRDPYKFDPEAVRREVNLIAARES